MKKKNSRKEHTLLPGSYIASLPPPLFKAIKENSLGISTEPSWKCLNRSLSLSVIQGMHMNINYSHLSIHKHMHMLCNSKLVALLFILTLRKCEVPWFWIWYTYCQNNQPYKAGRAKLGNPKIQFNSSF